MENARDMHRDDLLRLRLILSRRANTVEGMGLILDNALETVEILLRTVESLKKADDLRKP